MSLYATITRITDETSTVRVDGPGGALPLEQRIEHQPAPRTSLTELGTEQERASAAVLTAAAAQLLAERGFTLTDDWQRLGTYVPTYGAHAAVAGPVRQAQNAGA
ncbi:hypothetical protein [Amycolatopsis sp. cg9]|uniref:hypothetical protein n=1 Tax=Amycolatopsis sp. cg9 TaxID=3238801 RepID=UPI0035265F3B